MLRPKYRANFPRVLDGDRRMAAAGDVADVRLRRAERLRDGYLGDARLRDRFRHPMTTRVPSDGNRSR